MGTISKKRKLMMNNPHAHSNFPTAPIPYNISTRSRMSVVQRMVEEQCITIRMKM
jgi:hypothetical protein